VAFPLEAVPNFSDGRDRATIAALAGALGAHARLLDVHSDVDHNRSVFTLAGSAERLVESLVAGISCARERIDLRGHEGVHPRIGAADVVPVVAVRAEDVGRAKEAALELAARVGETGLPVFMYGEEGRGPAFFRRGGMSALQQRLDAGELEPDFGPARLDPSAGAVLVGARRPLIAFNVELQTDDLAVAREIAAVVREAGGGYPGVRALGFALPSRGIVQVSMNVEDPGRVALHEVVARVRREAAARGVQAGESELVGLLPASAAAQASREALGLPRLDESQLLEPRLLAGD
jgi:glutamate formiminotransferase